MKIPEYYYDNTFIPFKYQLIGDRPQRHYAAGEMLVNVGEYMTSTYYIHQGVLKLAIISNTGMEKPNSSSATAASSHYTVRSSAGTGKNATN